MYTEKLEKVVERANKYDEAGVDIIFIVGINIKKELEFLTNKIGYSLMINVNEVESLLDISYEDFKRLGIKIIMYPNVIKGTMMKSVMNL